jgi:hypothetical protein
VRKGRERLRDDRQWEKFEIATEPFLVSVVYIHGKLTGGPVSSHSIRNNVFLDNVWRDLGYAFRTMRRDYGFAVLPF